MNSIKEEVTITQADDQCVAEILSYFDSYHLATVTPVCHEVARHRTEATRPLTAEIADLRAQLDEAMEALGSVVNSCALRSLRGHDHVPSMREQQDALRAARAILAKRKQP